MIAIPMARVKSQVTRGPMSQALSTGVPLMMAALQLRRSRESVMRMILTGELHATQQDNGRWLVDAASLSRALEAQGAGAPLTAA